MHRSFIVFYLPAVRIDTVRLQITNGVFLCIGTIDVCEQYFPAALHLMRLHVCQANVWAHGHAMQLRASV